MLESLQVVAFGLMMNFDIPANVEMMKQIFFLFLNADVLDPTWTTGFFFSFDTEYSYVESAMEQDYSL